MCIKGSSSLCPGTTALHQALKHLIIRHSLNKFPSFPPEKTSESLKMYTNIVAALTAIMATSVFAAPQAGGSSASGNSLTVGDASQQCGNDQALSCCNTNSGDNTDQGGLIGSLLNGVLGGSCTQVPVTGNG